MPPRVKTGTHVHPFFGSEGGVAAIVRLVG